MQVLVKLCTMVTFTLFFFVNFFFSILRVWCLNVSDPQEVYKRKNVEGKKIDNRIAGKKLPVYTHCPCFCVASSGMWRKILLLKKVFPC